MMRVGHYAELLRVLRERADAEHVSYDEIGAVIGLTDRYFAKYMTWPPLKVMTLYTLFDTLDAMGLQMSLDVVGPPRAKPIVASYQKRRGKVMLSIGKNRIQRDGIRIHRLPDEHRQMSRNGGLLRAAKLSPRKRKAIARKAALVRWADVKAAVQQ